MMTDPMASNARTWQRDEIEPNLTLATGAAAEDFRRWAAEFRAGGQDVWAADCERQADRLDRLYPQRSVR